MKKAKEWPKKRKSPVSLKCDSELWEFIKDYCDSRGIKYQFFVEESLKATLEAKQDAEKAR